MTVLGVISCYLLASLAINKPYAKWQVLKELLHLEVSTGTIVKMSCPRRDAISSADRIILNSAYEEKSGNTEPPDPPEETADIPDIPASPPIPPSSPEEKSMDNPDLESNPTSPREPDIPDIPSAGSYSEPIEIEDPTITLRFSLVNECLSTVLLDNVTLDGQFKDQFRRFAATLGYTNRQVRYHFNNQEILPIWKIRDVVGLCDNSIIICIIMPRHYDDLRISHHVTITDERSGYVQDYCLSGTETFQYSLTDFCNNFQSPHLSSYGPPTRFYDRNTGFAVFNWNIPRHFNTNNFHLFAYCLPRDPNEYTIRALALSEVPVG